MRKRPLVLLACLLCLAGAWFFWPRPVNTRTKPSALQKVAAPAAPAVPAVTASKILTPNYVNSPKPGTVLASTNPFAFRLSNTTKPLDQLVHDRHAILLENALIDASRPLNFSIPKNLQSQGDPGAYIIQARGPIDAAFRAMLAQAGAEIVSYIPNNAYLVRAQAGVANGLVGNPLTQAVTPYEPYYKIQSSLLTSAIGQMDLSDDMVLTLGLFTTTAAQTIREIEKLGGKVLTQENTPVGTIVKVVPPKDWTALATLSGTKNVELSRQRIPANDLSRVAVGVATDTQVSSNYMNLTGQNVLVEVNDWGIDATHPDLAGRVFGSPMTDTDGHGTHVAGIIAGDGTESTTVTNASGSIMPATYGQFRGMAPLATLFSRNWYDSSDQELQKAAALTNALISNNSWNYGVAVYDLAAASYDAAVRDALPGVTGSQPVLFVFSAGNSGSGDDSSDPGGGTADTIQSPATAKNVITVGALQEFRDITNQVITISASGATNAPSTPWQLETSTSSRIAGFSSRGNVGINTEGTYGRFKPDVVAPGTFVVSTRSAQWDIQDYFFINPINHDRETYSGIIVQPGSFWANLFPVIANNTVQAVIYVEPNADSPVPFPSLPVYFGLLTSPTLNLFTINNQVMIPPDGGLTIAEILSTEMFFGSFNYAISNNTANPINLDLITDIVTTNNPGDYFLVLSNLNQSIGTPNPASTGPGPYYRYESGTSMSAADVSGVLALMMEYFIKTLHTTPSPALLKAMLINGARVTGYYNLQVQNPINYEGWGLINLPNSLPLGIMTGVSGSGSMLILDQSPANALATGDSHAYHVTVASAAVAQPLRITLAWTDPPGDPAAAIKLVNDLNLVVTNLDHPTNVYYGNDIPASSTYNTTESSTNAPVYDAINNVENVYLPPGVGANFSVTVLGYRINVNAVTAQTNNAAGIYAPNVVQDYALVISSGNGQVANALTVTDGGISINPTTDQQITYVITTNAPLLNQLVGASTPLLGTNQIQLTGGGTELNGIQLSPTNVLLTLGMTNQWHFYAVTNTGAADFTNAAFITFIPDTLAVPRMGVFQNSVGNATRPEADIDLYVSSNPRLMDLDPVVISNADKSVGRGGTEFVYYTNSAPGKVYYIGVYSEDQEASEYGFIPIFTDIPFSQPGPNGSEIVNGLNLPVSIPDGTPAHPGSGYIFALAINPMDVDRVVVTNTLTHQNFGDLIGTLTHSQQNGLSESVVLNNHESLGNAPGPYTQIYDDSGWGDITSSRPSDGPGSLNSFMGQHAVGPWILTEVDDAWTQLGTNTFFSLLIDPHQDLTKGLEVTLGPLGWYYDYIDVPAGATNLTFFATNLTASGTVDFFVRYGAEPTLTNYDERVQLTPGTPNGTISIGSPLTPGRYFIGLYNESLQPQTVYVIATLGVGAAPGQVIFSSSGPAQILDDAVMTNSIYVTAAQLLSSVDVALRVDHPRVSDLVFHLTSPDGTRVLLVENRGGATPDGMGVTLAITNVVPVSSSGSTAPTTNLVSTVSSNGTMAVQYNFYPIPDQMVVYDQGGNLIFDSGMVSGSGVFNIAYTNSSVLTIEMNPNGNPGGSGDYWDYTVTASQVKYTYLVLTEDTNQTTTPIKFAPVPFHGALTNMVTISSVTSTNLVAVTNTATVITTITNITLTTNITGVTGISDGFENHVQQFNVPVGSSIDGWRVVSGNVDVYNPTLGGHLGTADSGTNVLDLNGSIPGSIATNFTTIVGQQYVLTFAYTKNPSPANPGYPYFIASANIDITGQPTIQLNTPATLLNSYDYLNWQHATIVFTATSPTTTLQFSSLNNRPDTSGGMFLDTIKVAECVSFNGFEGAAAGDYVLGVNQHFDGWTVLSNQVTVIGDAALANPRGTNLLALAGGTISRILPTLPGRTYSLSYAYRGPDAVALWRGNTNGTDSVGTNIFTQLGGVGFTNAEVRQGFFFDGGVRRVTAPDAPDLNVGTNDFSVDTWIQAFPMPGNWHSTETVFDKRLAPDSQTQLGYEMDLTSGYLNLQMADHLAAFSWHNFTAPPSSQYLWDGQWHHIAATVVRKSRAGGNLYVDGQVVLNFDPTVCPGSLVNTGVFRLGNHADVTDGLSTFFNGAIDEFTLYQRALSASEIKAIYQKGSSGKYDTNAPSPFAQGLAEARMTVGATAFPTFYGSNTNWQTTNITFTAAQSNLVLQITGLEPGMLLDNLALVQFAATNITYLTNITYVTNTIYAANGFEGAAAGDYIPGQFFDGWDENNNQVTVISNATLADEGTNLLALANGRVTRILPTLPGQTYNLSYAYRGPGAVALWRGESNTLDSINGIIPDNVVGIGYTNGKVRAAFRYDGSTSLITVPPSPSLAVSNLTIDAWVFSTDDSTPRPIVEYGGGGQLSSIALWINTTGGGGTVPGGIQAYVRLDNNTAFVEVTDADPVVTTNQWNHLAFTVNAATLTGILYCNGVQVGSAITIPIGSPVIPINFGSAPVNLGYRDINSLDIMPGAKFSGNLDEVSIYNRDLSASEIQAICQNGSSGKYDTNAPSIAQGLAGAQMTVDGFSYPVFYGSNTNWQTNTITFVASQSNSVLQIAGLEPGMLLDNFALTEWVITTQYSTNSVLNGGDIYYLPEQSLDTVKGENAYGQWQLEVWDNRAGAGVSNTLVSWQLRFNFPTPVSSIGTLTNGTLTNYIPAGSIQWIRIPVPANADIATNLLLYATNSAGTLLPLNVWFNQTTPPSGTNSPGDFLLISGTNGTAILYTNGVPPLVPGADYWIGFQNTNGTGFYYGFQVDFHLLPQVNVLTNGLPQTNSIPTNSLVYYVVHVPTNADWATNLLLSATGPLNVWFNPTNLPVGTNPPDILLFGGATSGIAVFGTNTVPTNIVPGGTYYLAVQNLGAASVTYGIEVDFHLIWPSVAASNIVYFPVNVPTNADFATNILVFATGPLNLWFTTNSPPSITNANDILLLPNGAYPSGMNGSVVFSAGTTPPLVPGSTYWLGVQNTNSFAVNFTIEVDFHLLFLAITGPTITHTNIGGTDGFLLQWQGPTNFQYEIQWTTTLAPPVWQTVLNPVINVVLTPTNGHYSWFDDGTLTGGFGPMKFYRILGGLNLGPIPPGSGPVTNIVLAGAMSQAVVTVPANALWASNVLLSATSPLNVWFNQTNPPTGNTGAGDQLMLSTATAGAFVLTSSSVPPLVPGTNYYLGFQNPGTSDVTFSFQVTFGLAPTNAVTNFTITAINGGLWLRWNGLTNYLYQVQWTTNLAPPAWNTVPNVLLSSTNGIFAFFDNGSLTGGLGPMKFYRLIAWPLPTGPQTLSFSSVTVTNIGGTNDLMLKWSAPTNYQYGIQWTTNLALPLNNWFIIVSPVLTLTNGVYTFIDNGQTGPPATAKFFRLFEY